MAKTDKVLTIIFARDSHDKRYSAHFLEEEFSCFIAEGETMPEAQKKLIEMLNDVRKYEKKSAINIDTENFFDRKDYEFTSIKCNYTEKDEK